MSALTVYPSDDYNSWASADEAEEFFEWRIHAGDWNSADPNEQIAALRTAYNSLAELSIDLTDLDSDDQALVDAILSRLKNAQCEQAYWEIQGEHEAQDVSQFGLGGLLQVTLSKRDAPTRFSPRAMGLLRPYLTVRTIARTR